MKTLLKLNLVWLLAIALVFTACEDDNGDSDPNAPDSYSAFENVNYSGQTDRLNMLKELTAEMKKGNEGTAINEQTLLDMYANANDPFTFTSEKDLKSKTFPNDVSEFETLLSGLAAISGSTDPASDGTAGILTSAMVRSLIW